MYGTIARLKVKPDHVEALQRLTANYDDLEVPGFVGTHVYRMDADETEFYLVVLFEDRETYRKNADDPRIGATGRCANSSPKTRTGTTVRWSGARRAEGR